MGLDTTHDCWHGPYSAFMRWRTWLADQVGIPLALMEGYCRWFEYRAPDEYSGDKLYDFQEPKRCDAIPWSILGDDPLVALLSHSDCDDEIAAEKCGPLANRLVAIRDAIPQGNSSASDLAERADYDGNRAALSRFIDGLRNAAAANESVEFH